MNAKNNWIKEQILTIKMQKVNNSLFNLLKILVSLNNFEISIKITFQNNRIFYIKYNTNYIKGNAFLFIGAMHN